MENSPCITEIDNRAGHECHSRDREQSGRQIIVSDSGPYNSKLCLTRTMIGLGALLFFNLVITSLLSLDHFNSKARLQGSGSDTGELNINGEEIVNMNKIQEEIDSLRLQIKKPEEETCFEKRKSFSMG